MPFSRPTLSSLRNLVAGDINTALAGADGFLRRANLNVIGTVQAGMSNLQYGYLDWIALQAVPFTATDEFLQGWAALKNVTQLAATVAGGGATSFPASDGVVVPMNTQMVRGDGAIFITTADATAGGGTVIAPGVSQATGAISNTDVGTAMTLGVAIAGVNSNGTVSTAYTGGADVETQDALRTRMLQRYASPPQGGAAQDYVTWALEVNGVTRAWVLPNGAGPGTVVVYTMWDLSELNHGGFPQGSDGVATNETRGVTATGDQLEVANYIYGPSRQPVTALVYSVSPVADPKAFTIANLIPNTTAMKTAIASAITDVFLRNGSPGGVKLPDGTVGGTVYMADINAAIDAIPGITDFIITSPATDIVSATGYLATLGVITWA